MAAWTVRRRTLASRCQLCVRYQEPRQLSKHRQSGRQARTPRYSPSQSVRLISPRPAASVLSGPKDAPPTFEVSGDETSTFRGLIASFGHGCSKCAKGVNTKWCCQIVGTPSAAANTRPPSWQMTMTNLNLVRISLKCLPASSLECKLSSLVKRNTTGLWLHRARTGSCL